MQSRKNRKRGLTRFGIGRRRRFRSDRRVRRRFEVLERRDLLSADVGRPVGDHVAAEPSVSEITWFESYHDVNRIAPSQLSHIDRPLPPGVAGPREPAIGEWIVQLTSEAARELRRLKDAELLLRGWGAEFSVISGLGKEGSLLVRGVAATQSDIEASFGANLHVAAFGLNELIEGQAITSNDPELIGGLLPGLEIIDAADAWEDTIGSLTTVVGVVDSGIDPTHPDLYLNIWLNQGELPPAFLDDAGNRLRDIDGDGLISFYDLNNVTRSQNAPFSLVFGGWESGPNAEFVRDLNGNDRIDAHDLLEDIEWADGRDTDGNGFFDDLFGVNFRSGADDPFAENDPDDELGHGTHVSGTIAAIGGNGLGVVGVNWQTSLMSLRILDNNNQGDSGAAILAVNYARRMREQFRSDDQGRVVSGANVRVLNNSWGQPGGFEQSLETAIEDVGDAGVLFVAAAGNGNVIGQGVDNDATSFFPASYQAPNVIAVASSDAADRLATYSNFGAESVDLVAPGVGIRSTVPGGGYQSANGTSMATPHVAGTAALIWSFLPEATVDEVRQAILQTATPIAQSAVVATGARLNTGSALPSGVFAPATQLSSHEDIKDAGGTGTEFTVEYRHSSGIDPTTIGDDDLVVTREWGPSGPITPTLKTGSLVESIDGKSIFATYELSAPGSGSFKSASDPRLDLDSLTYDIFENPQVIPIGFAQTVTSQILVENQATLFERGLFVEVATEWDRKLVISLIAPNGSRILLADLGGSGGNFQGTQFRDDADRSISVGSEPYRGAFKPQEKLSSLGVTDPNGVWTLEVQHVCEPSAFDFFCSGTLFSGAAIEGWSIGLPRGVSRLTSELLVSNVSQIGSDFTVSFDTSLASFVDAGATLTSPAGDRVVLFEGHTADYLTNVSTTFDDQASGPVVDLASPLTGRFQPQQTLATLADFSPNGAWELELTGDFELAGPLPELRWGLDFAGTWDVLDFGDYEITTVPDSVAANDGSRAADPREVGSFRVQIDDPSVHYVTQFSDSLEPGSLRSAIIDANASTADRNIVILEQGRYSLAIPPIADPASTFPDPDPDAIGRRVEGPVWSNETTGDLDITGSVLLFGDTNKETTIDAAGIDRVFKVHPGAEFGMHRVTVQGGVVPAIQAGGGGILSAGDLELRQVVVRDNAALNGPTLAPTYGGGVAVWDGAAAINDSWITDNVSDQGSGLFVAGDANARIRRSTISAHSQGGLMSITSGDVQITNSTFSGNRGQGGAIWQGFAPSSFEFDVTSDISSDGRFVVFESEFDDLVPGDQVGTEDFAGGSDIFLYDRLQETIALVSVNSHGEQANGDSSDPTISADGRFVAFESEATNLVADDNNQDTDIFVLDRQTGAIERVSVSADGVEGNHDSFSPAISADGQVVAFYSRATNLVPADENDSRDVFVVDRNAGTITRISVSQDGEEGDGDSYDPAVSADGRYVAFESDASNLVAGDTNGDRDIFVYELQNKSLDRVSVRSDGAEANNHSFDPAVSGDGRLIVYQSAASNLVSDDTSSRDDIFVYDRIEGSVERVTVDGDGMEADGTSVLPSVTPDGRFIAFGSSADNLVSQGLNPRVNNLFVVDRLNQTVELITTEADGDSFRPRLSADGRFVSFESYAENLVDNDGNGEEDPFLYDRQLGVMHRLRRNLGDLVITQSTVMFTSQSEAAVTGSVRIVNSLFAGNVVAREVDDDVRVDESSAILSDTQLPLIGPLTRRITLPPVHPLHFGNAAIDAADPLTASDFDQHGQVRVAADLGAFEASLASVSGVVYADLNRNGSRDPGEAAIDDVAVEVRTSSSGLVASQLSGRSASGRVTFDSLPPENYQIAAVVPSGWSAYRPTPVIARPASGEPNNSSNSPSLSGDGRIVAFDSFANNLVPDDVAGHRDVFVFDRQNGVVERTSDTFLGLIEAEGSSSEPSVSKGGRYVAFESFATNLVSDDTNGRMDVFVRDRQTGSNERVSVSGDGVEANGSSSSPSISGDGRFVSFSSSAGNLVPGDTNGREDVFVFDRQTSAIERISLATDGSQGSGDSDDPFVSASGRYVTFTSAASNLVTDDTNFQFDVFIVDRQTELIERVSVNDVGEQGNSGSLQASVSDDGRFVTFRSFASNLVPDDTNDANDVFLYDRMQKTIERVSVAANGEQADDASLNPSISRDGRFVSFSSSASNLVPDDDNGVADIFVYDRLRRAIARVSVAANGEEANGESDAPAISADGESIAFVSNASNLVAGDGNARQDIVIVSNPFSEPVDDLTLRVGESISDLNLGLVPDPGIISGRVFDDTVANEVFDAGESVFEGTTVFLDLNGNGVRDDAEPSRVTGDDGSYEFTDVASFRPHSVVIERPLGWEQVNPTAEQRFTWNLFLPAGGTVRGRDFALRRIDSSGQSSASAISGRLFDDRNDNGVFDQGTDLPVVGREVFLDASNFGTRDTNEPRELTDEQGRYSFIGLSSQNVAVTTGPDATMIHVSPLGSDFELQKYPLFDRLQPFGNPQAIATADFNGDGYLDVTVALGEANKLSVRLNDGAGGFRTDEIDVDLGDAGAGPSSIVARHFNQNTLIDVAVTASFASNVMVLLDFNPQTRTFTSQQTLSVGEEPLDLVSGNFGGDSALDLVVVNKADNTVQLLTNDGDGGFSVETPISTGATGAVSIVAGDFTGDTIPDVAVTHASPLSVESPFGGVTLLEGDGTGGLLLGEMDYATGAVPLDSATADFNGDGRSDIAVANFGSNTIAVLLAQSDGSMRVQQSFLGTASGAYDIAVADIENDGDVDVIASNLRDRNISIFRNLGVDPATGDAQFAPLENIGLGQFSLAQRMPLAVGNFDHDTSAPGGLGTVDIITVPRLTDTLHVLTNRLVDGSHRVALTGLNRVMGLDFIVQPAILPPTFDVIIDPAPVVQDATVQTIVVSGVSQPRSTGPPLRFAVISSNEAIVTNASVVYAAGSETATVRYQPVAGASGVSELTVTALDAGADQIFDTPDDGVFEQTFTVTILPANDPDRIEFLTPLLTDSQSSTTAAILATSSAGGSLDVSIDLNRDGDWDDAGEQRIVGATVSQGTTLVAMEIPAATTPGLTYVRVHTRRASGLSKIADYGVTVIDATSPQNFTIDLNKSGDLQLRADNQVVRLLSGQSVVFAAPSTAVAKVQFVGVDGNPTMAFRTAGLVGVIDVDPSGTADRLASGGAAILDFAVLNADDLRGIDVIDLRDGVSNQVMLPFQSVKNLSDSGQLRLVYEFGDLVDVGPGWKYQKTSRENESIVHSFTNADATLLFETDRFLTNPVDAFDVNASGDTTALDALQVVNELRQRVLSDGDSVPPGRNRSAGEIGLSQFRFHDVTGDGRVSALDALRVINELTRGSTSSSGEQVGAIAWVGDTTDEEIELPSVTSTPQLLGNVVKPSGAFERGGVVDQLDGRHKPGAAFREADDAPSDQGRIVNGPSTELLDAALRSMF